MSVDIEEGYFEVPPTPPLSISIYLYLSVPTSTHTHSRECKNCCPTTHSDFSNHEAVFNSSTHKHTYIGRGRGAYKREGWPPSSRWLFTWKSSGESFFYYFFREVKERDTLAVDSRAEPIDLNVFLRSSMTVLFLFLFPFTPRPFYEDSYIFFNDRYKKPFFFSWFFSSLPSGGKNFKRERG